MRRQVGIVGLSVTLLLAATVTAHATKCDPTGADKTAIENARTAVATNCDCATATNHGTYVKCSSTTLNTLVQNKQLNPSCKGLVQKCAAKSTCGKLGFVTCCKTNATGKTTCSIKSDAGHCTPPHGGSACVSNNHTSCCDACTTSGCASPSGAFIDGLDLSF